MGVVEPQPYPRVVLANPWAIKVAKYPNSDQMWVVDHPQMTSGVASTTFKLFLFFLSFFFFEIFLKSLLLKFHMQSESIL
jgi:hypothetical protein